MRSAAIVDRVIVLTLTALLTIAPFLSRAAAATAALAIVALMILAWHRRAPAATSLGVFSMACVVLGTAGVGPQQVLFPVAFAIYAVVVSRTPWLRSTASWLQRGTLDGTLLALAAGIAALSAVTLLAWYAVTKPDLADLIRIFVPDQPLWILIAGALLFSLLNAAIEEAAYRGLLLGALDAAVGAGTASVLLQAIAFGALHVHGFPRGAAGVGLAFVYGLGLGFLRRKAGGLLAPWVAHVLTDLVIAGIVLTLAHD